MKRRPYTKARLANLLTRGLLLDVFSKGDTNKAVKKMLIYLRRVNATIESVTQSSQIIGQQRDRGEVFQAYYADGILRPEVVCPACNIVEQNIRKEVCRPTRHHQCDDDRV